VTGPGPELTADVVAAFDEAASDHGSTVSGFAGPVASRLARLRPGWRVPDAGCGAGAVLIRVARAVCPGGALTGIDRAPPCLRSPEGYCST
jgi:2-polyprenyl-3-methyl-5-hydroxy-6-metoxy-1,4-benzoquinol methylase